MSASLLHEAVAHNKARYEEYGPWKLLRLTDKYHEAPRGSVVIDGKVIYGYPSIGRILRLATGLQHQFRAPFWVEEKVDGYNVRLARVGEDVLAFSRGGFVCPFTTDRAPDLADLRILREQPDLVLCAEVAGPGQPYISGHPPYIKEDVQLFVFDMMRTDRAGYLPQPEKQALLEEYKLPAVCCYGRYRPDQVEEMRALLAQLTEEGREGVVMKEDSTRDHRTKLVTSYSCMDDIRGTVDHLRDLPAEYFVGRVLRLALFLEEQGEEQVVDVRRQLGSAFLDGLSRAIEQSKREQRVYHTHRCRFRDPENARRLLRHMKRSTGHAHVAQRRLEKEGEYYVLEFDKLHAAMSGLLGHVLGGGLVFD